MTDRRVFLKSAAVLSAAPFAARAAFATPGARTRFDAFVFDTRHAAAERFAARATQLQVPIRGTAGAVTGLWQQELRSHWRGAPAAIGGLTERPALFLLEQLGWEHGLRVVFQAEHEIAAGAAVRHRVIRGSGPALGRELEQSRADWPGLLAEALLSGTAAPGRDYRPTDAAMAAELHESNKLYSWIIAPRSAV
jgi:hypothetical protein